MPSMPTTTWGQLPRAVRRGLATLVLSTVIGLLVSAVLAEPVRESVVYAVCVSLAIWAFIDGGRLLAARWVHRHDAAPLQGPRSGWPGWAWMVPILLLGTVAGFALGHTVAGALLGRGLGHTASMNPRTLITILLLSLVPGPVPPRSSIPAAGWPPPRRRPSAPSAWPASSGWPCWPRSWSRTCCSTRWPTCAC